MIYEYALEPSTFTDESMACFILEAFGRDKGRLISETKKEHWVRLVRDAIRTSGNKTIARQKLKEALKILVKKQKALYCRHQQIKGTDWLNIVEKNHSNWPYRGIFLEQYDGKEKHYLTRDIHLNKNPIWAAPTSITIKREPEAMVMAVAPMLINAKEIMLVDRNFKFEDGRGNAIKRYKNVLIEFLSFLASKPYGPSVYKVTYHIGIDRVYHINKTDLKHLKTLGNKYIKNDLPHGFKLELAVWPWDKLHDRYVLTDIGAIKYGHGLDQFNGSNRETVNLNRQSNADHVSLWSEFKQPKNTVVVEKI